MSETASARNEATALDAAASKSALDAFIRSVGGRVRSARQQRGLSRRAVSELSGVSQRYLAQLESGEGNISIALLYKVAHALGHPVEWFVGADNDSSPDVTHMAHLIHAADAEQRQRIFEILNDVSDTATRARRFCLIGVRGAGKSTLGRKAGEALSMPFVELNAEIEDLSGMPIEEVLALYGQDGFRALEHQALQRMAAETDEVIVAVAGGIVSEPDAYDFLLGNFHTIWLKATPEEHMDRVRAQGDYRPMAGNPLAMDELRSILTSREELYAKAGRAIDTSGKSVDDSLRDVLCVIEELQHQR